MTMWGKLAERVKNTPTPWQTAERTTSTNLFNRIGQMQGNELIGTPGMLAGGPDAMGQLARLRRGTLGRGIAAGADAMGGLQSDLALDKLSWDKEQIRRKQAKKDAKGNVLGKIGGAALGAGVGFLKGGPAGAAIGAGTSLMGGGAAPMPDGGYGGYDTGGWPRKKYPVANDATYG